MTDRSGIDRLARAIDEVAATLPASRHRRPRTAPRLVAAAALLAALGGAAWWVATHGAQRTTGVEVVFLKLEGRPAVVRVFDAPPAGTIVVAPAAFAPAPAAVVTGRIQ
jgi:hypothetical protein